MNTKHNRWTFNVTKEEIAELFRFEKDSESTIKTWLWLLGFILAPIALIGALFGYARAYNRFYKHSEQPPKLANLTPITKVSMLIFAVLFFVGYWLIVYLLYHTVVGLMNNSAPLQVALIVIGLMAHFFWCTIAFGSFQRWQNGINSMMLALEKFGTARFALLTELNKFYYKKGIYIGGNYRFSEKFHMLTVAGTRGGKGTNLIIPNLLGVGGYEGSYCVIDVKGENSVICSRYLRSQGKKVVILNPWNLFSSILGQAHNYNPLDILIDKNSIHLVDDIQMVAELLVPIERDQKDSFFTDNARSIVAGLLLHLMTSDEADKSLTKLWEWVRFTENSWNDLLGDMAVSDDPLYGKAISNSANEILKLSQAGDRTFGSIIATVLQCTDFY